MGGNAHNDPEVQRLATLYDYLQCGEAIRGALPTDCITTSEEVQRVTLDQYRALYYS